MRTTAVFEFHVSRAAREQYQFDELLFAFNGNVVFANPMAARQFAARINAVRGVQKDPARAARPADLFAMGLIDEALHALVAMYRRQVDQRAMTDALAWFDRKLGHDNLEFTLTAFVQHFPPIAVHRREQTAMEWLGGSTEGLPHRAVALEEMMMLWLANANPAFKKYAELFDDTILKDTAYRAITAGFRDYFETRPRFGRRKQNLFDVLRAPALASPDSLSGQLAFLRENYKEELSAILVHILTALDVLKEEELAIWSVFHPPTHEHRHFGTPQDMGDSTAAAVPQFGYKGQEFEHFSPDVDWMPSTVLLAKTVFVWLDQLSKQYRRHIHSLDQVPDEELAIMARRGFNSLWLIGLWERSQASRRIKQLMGNADAAASAYSLMDYQIAHDLGGEAAYHNFRERASRYGIRLASDMVPNHMGIDSRWVTEHPDWFLSLPYSPYPSYSFDGPDLSSDGRVEIKIEDHYYDKTDASVVFRRVDRHNGDTRYVYHGNDGTTFPWNDTAQLNYLNPEVREAIIQTIIHVARMFPIIRFDAAMTLTKQHFQRLWFPAPGTGGAIPSRAEHGLSKADFDRLMPAEFWREVVDRIAVEVPGTLLLAEAFWLLEGYFVRTLGMHRVYNSAFMNMLRDEENANYRSVIKNTLEFDPEVLKRYVNFMNNPDERTAIDQFGKGDKYFGVCTLLATFPGLPMFGHGQVEGYSERYGMEFRRAQRDEVPDQWLEGRHEREISPLLHRRPVFAEVNEFLLYDFYTDGGSVNEDVYAFTNRRGNDRALVVFHNRYAHTTGWIRISCAYAERQGDGSKRLRQRSIGEAFGLHHDANLFVAYRDLFTGQEFLQRASDVAERGLRLVLGAYEHHVLLDWRDLRDDATHRWSELCDHLEGRGVPSLDDALRTLELRPVHEHIGRLLSARIVGTVIPSELTEATPSAKTVAPEAAAQKKSAKATPSAKDKKATEKDAEAVAAQKSVAQESSTAKSNSASEEPAWRELLDRAEHFYNDLGHFIGTEVQRSAGTELRPSKAWDTRAAVEMLKKRVDELRRIPALVKAFRKPAPDHCANMLPTRATESAAWGATLAWVILEVAGRVAAPDDPEHYAMLLFDHARLRHPIAEALEKLGAHGEDRWRAAARLRFAFAHAASAHKIRQTPGRSSAPLSWLHDSEVAWLIGSNEHQGVRYFNKEQFEQLLWWMALRPLMEIASEEKPDQGELQELEADMEKRCKMAASGGYRMEALLESGSVL
jgi:Alpha amylase, catalytic domain